MIENLKLLVALITLIFGLVAVILPKGTAKAMYFSLKGGRGAAEFRVGVGAFFVGMGAMAIYLNDANVFQMLGVAYLVAATTRVLAIFLDKPNPNGSYLGFLVVEIASGVILVL